MWPDTKVPVCRVVSAGVHVLWLDNFSKLNAVAVQGLDTGAAAECLWTTRGLHRSLWDPLCPLLCCPVCETSRLLSLRQQRHEPHEAEDGCRGRGA